VEMLNLWPNIYNTLISNHIDCIGWKHHNGVWSVRHAWEATKEAGARVDWHQLVWSTPTIHKCSITAWQTLHGKLTTSDVFQSRGYHLTGVCFLCHNSEENIDHLFFTYAYSSLIWIQILRHLGIFRLPKPTFSMEVDCFSRYFHSNGIDAIVAKLAFRVALWRIWQERCSRIYSQVTTSNIQLLISIVEDVEEDLKANP